MSVTPTQAKLAKFTGDLYIADADTAVGGSFTLLGPVRGLAVNIDTTNEEFEVLADNSEPVISGYKSRPEIVCQYLESFDRDLMDRLINGTTSNVAGTLVSGATQTAASGAWAYKQFIKIENQNGDGSAITVNSVTAATDGALVADTDFYVGQNDAGEYGIYVIDSATVTTTSQALTIDYDYTPNTEEVLTITPGFSEHKYVALKIVSDTGNSKTNTIYMSKAKFNGTYSLGFTDISESQDVVTTDATFTAEKNSTVQIKIQNL